MKPGNRIGNKWHNDGSVKQDRGAVATFRLAGPGSWGLLLSCLLLAAWGTGSGQLHYSVPEEAKHGTFVGRIAQDLGLELAELVPRLFRVASKERGDLLEVNVQNGILFVNSRIDREELCGRSAECGIHLEVIVDRPLQVFHVEVEVRDINDNPPVFSVTEQKILVPESRLLDSRFPLEGACDADVGENSMLTYKLSSNEFFVLDVISKKDKSKSPVLVLRKLLDREENPRLNLLLTATDGGKPEFTGSVSLLILVLDANDNAPVFDRPVYEVKMYENQVNQTLVIWLNASDTDEGINRELEYSFSSLVPPVIRRKFLINEKTGEVKVNDNIDFEESNNYEIHVDVTDKGNPPMAGHCTVLVEILDENDNSPEIIVTSLSLSVKEDAQVGTVIALISVSDRDSGGNGQVTCSLTPHVPFRLVSTFKNYYSLVLDSALDRETTPGYEVVVTARDGGAPALWATASVSVEVADVNDNAPAFAQAEHTVFVKENNPPGAHIFTVSATDADAQENARVTYSLVERRVGERALSSYVSVHAQSGRVHALQPLDHEELELLRFQVSARDAGEPALDGQVTLQVFVLDDNDNAPALLGPEAGVQAAGVSQLLWRSVGAGHVVTKVRAVDADSGYNAWLSYELQPEAGGARSPFRVGLYTGEISTTRALDEADAPRQRLLVLVKDHGEPALTATATVLLSLVDSGQAPKAPSRSRALVDAAGPEASLLDVNVYLIVAICAVSSLLVLTLLLYVALRCSAASPTEGACGPGKPVLVCSSAVGSWSYSQQRRHRVCSGEGPPKADLMAFSPSLPPCPVAGLGMESQSIAGDESDKDPLELHKMRVHVLDINDNAPIFPAGDVQLHIPEFLTPGARFTLPNAQDADEGSNSVLSYSLSPSQHFRLDMGSRIDGSKYPELVLEKALDREQRDTHLLVLTAQDGGLPARSGDAQVTIIVVDTNDNAPMFEHSVYSTKVPETAPNGTVLFQVRAWDLDEGSNGEVWYSLSNSTLAELRHLFHVHPKSGEVQVAASLGPPETLLEAYVEARDEGAFGLASTTKLLVRVTDVNDHAPEMDFMTFFSPVPEDVPSGTVIALLSVKDEDLGSNGRITCSMSSKGPFQLKSSFDNYYTLLTDGPLDREQANEYQVLITASDGGSPPLSTRRSLTVSVADVNDNAPHFSQPQQELFVAENNNLGVSLGHVFAQDPDLGKNGLVFYKLLDVISEGIPAPSLVAVEPSNGVIIARTSFDFEQLRGFCFQVEGRDGGSPPRSATVTVNLFVVDRNDNAPDILFPLLSNGSIPVEIVPRSARAGHLVTKVVAEDSDSGSNAWLSYHIIQASDSSLFRISVNTGELRTARLVLPTDAIKQKVVVVVRDHGDPPLSSSIILGVLLSNSAPQVLPDYEDIWEPEGQLSTQNLYLVIALACVSFLFLGCLFFFVCAKLSQSPDCCSQSCCHFSEDMRHGRMMASNPCMTSATIDVTTIERLSQTYLYRASLGLGSDNNNLLLHREYNVADLRNLATGVGLNLPISSIQIRNKKGDHANVNAMPRQPNPDWRYSASLRAGMHSSVHLEEAGILRAGPGGPDQQWPTVSSATPEPEAGEVSPPVGAGVNSNSWTFKYGPSNPKQSGPEPKKQTQVSFLLHRKGEASQSCQ
uniref:protocadherin alpha-9 isoform X2 n=1 Tax=Jaculus jaculus TaxID=51337 RepID=UPI001E1B419E|nr:protocadherin alpha-9 isoform X2 [Jaculus jaculus]